MRKLPAALVRAYRKPHSRLTRDWRWIAARLICYPIMAAFGAVALVGSCDPAIFTDVIIDGVRVRVSQ